jgi:hypothetical protein
MIVLLDVGFRLEHRGEASHNQHLSNCLLHLETSSDVKVCFPGSIPSIETELKLFVRHLPPSPFSVKHPATKARESIRISIGKFLSLGIQESLFLSAVGHGERQMNCYWEFESYSHSVASKCL